MPKCKECHQQLPGPEVLCCLCEKPIDYPDSFFFDGRVIGRGNHEYHFHNKCLREAKSIEYVEQVMDKKLESNFSGVVRIF